MCCVNLDPFTYDRAICVFLFAFGFFLSVKLLLQNIGKWHGKQFAKDLPDRLFVSSITGDMLQWEFGSPSIKYDAIWESMLLSGEFLIIKRYFQQDKSKSKSNHSDNDEMNENNDISMAQNNNSNKQNKNKSKDKDKSVVVVPGFTEEYSDAVDDKKEHEMIKILSFARYVVILFPYSIMTVTHHITYEMILNLTMIKHF